MNPEIETPQDWVRRIDLQWIEVNFETFQRAVSKVLDKMGRGAVAVDMTAPPVKGGHPFSYWPQSYLKEHADENVMRLVGEYLPSEELVVILLKLDRKSYAYQVGPAHF